MIQIAYPRVVDAYISIWCKLATWRFSSEHPETVRDVLGLPDNRRHTCKSWRRAPLRSLAPLMLVSLPSPLSETVYDLRARNATILAPLPTSRRFLRAEIWSSTQACRSAGTRFRIDMKSMAGASLGSIERSEQTFSSQGAEEDLMKLLGDVQPMPRAITITFWFRSGFAAKFSKLTCVCHVRGFRSKSDLTKSWRHIFVDAALDDASDLIIQWMYACIVPCFRNYDSGWSSEVVYHSQHACKRPHLHTQLYLPSICMHKRGMKCTPFFSHAFTCCTLNVVLLTGF